MRGHEARQQRFLADSDYVVRRPDIVDGIGAEDKVALVDSKNSEILTIMTVREKYSIVKKLEAEHSDPKQTDSTVRAAFRTMCSSLAKTRSRKGGIAAAQVHSSRIL